MVQLTVSESAAKRLRDAIQKTDPETGKPLGNVEDTYIRVFVRGGGCSGFQYGMALDHKVQEGDEVIQNDGVKFVGIAVDDTEANARMFVRKFGLTFPTGFDATGQIMRDYQINFMPRTYFIGKDGMLLYAHHGMISEEQLLLAITELKKEQQTCKTC